jgi:hypothetical protein
MLRTTLVTAILVLASCQMPLRSEPALSGQDVAADMVFCPA